MILTCEKYNELISIITEYKSRKASKINLEEDYQDIRKYKHFHKGRIRRFKD